MDDKTIGIILLVGVMAIVSAFFGGIGAMNAKNDPPKKKWKYDERQIADQRKAYQYAFFTLLAYLLVFAVLDSLEIIWCTTAFGLSLGVALSFLVFAAFCIFCDAFSRDAERVPNPLAVINGVGAAVANLLSQEIPEGIIENGCFANGGIPLLIFLLIFSIDLCVLVRWIQNRRAKGVNHGR